MLGIRLMRLVREVGQDLRFGVRVLLRSPGFVLAATASLTIGIGVPTVLFTNLQSTIFRHVPGVSEPGELIRIQRPLPYSTFERFREEPGQLKSSAAFMGPVPFVISRSGMASERIWGHLASPGYFSVLGTRPLAGRLFGPGEQGADGTAVVVVSAAFARSRFGSPFEAIGKPLRLNGQVLTIIGVTEEKFIGASPFLASADVWVPTTAPLQSAPELRQLHDRTPSFEIFGRLSPGSGPRQAEAQLESLARQLERIHNDPGKNRAEPRVRLVPGGRLFPIPDEDMPAALGLPVVLAILVLAMACGNVANMLIARGGARRREIAVRLSIGASRGRLVRQMLVESTLLALLGGVGGLIFAAQTMSFYGGLRPLLPGHIFLDFQFDWRAMAASAIVTFAAALAVGILPAMQATSGEVSAALKNSVPSRLALWRWLSLRNIVVTNQVLTSMVLLLLTGFIVVGFSRSSSLNLGFDTHDLYLLNLDPVRDGLDPASAALRVEQLTQRARRIAGVVAVSPAQSLPVAFTSGETITAAKMEVAEGAKSTGSIRSDRVGEGFFETTGIAILRGRPFTRQDISTRAQVAVVNETLARREWPGRDPLGQRLDFEGRNHEVIGVARDIRPAMPLATGQAGLYQPVSPADYAVPSRYGITLLVRATPGFDAAASLRTATASLDPRLTVFNLRRMDDIAQESLFFARLAVNVYGAMGIFAMILACTGLAGVTAHAVAQRTREIGIRMALGAPKANIYRLVMEESALMILIGGTLGFGIALGVMRALASVLNVLAESTRTSIADPILLAGAPILLAGITLLVCYLPAREAVRIDPSSSLRAE